MKRASSLACRECATTAPLDTAVQYCAECFGPLDVVLDAPSVTGEDLRARIAGRPESMWRYEDLLPYDAPPGAERVGFTPLVPAPTLGARLGVADLWLKDDTANPSGSFKDRVVAAALGRAVAEGRSVAAGASTGNLARALAVGAGAAGLSAVILVPDTLPHAEVGALVSLGATAVRVAGGYDGVNRLATEAAMARDDWAWVNVGLRPWYVEGSTPLAYETAEQLGWRRPAHVVVPIASGALAVRLDAGFADLVDVGLLPDGPRPHLWAAQPAGCAPVATAFAAGTTVVAPVRPATAVASLAMGDPPDGDAVLRAARSSGGAVLAVDEQQVVAMVELVADTEGIAVEPAGGVTIGAVADLAAAGRFADGGPVVAYLTGGAPAPPASGVDEVPGSIEPSLAALTEEIDK